MCVCVCYVCFCMRTCLLMCICECQLNLCKSSGRGPFQEWHCVIVDSFKVSLCGGDQTYEMVHSLVHSVDKPEHVRTHTHIAHTYSHTHTSKQSVNMSKPMLPFAHMRAFRTRVSSHPVSVWPVIIHLLRVALAHVPWRPSCQEA